MFLGLYSSVAAVSRFHVILTNVLLIIYLFIYSSYKSYQKYTSAKVKTRDAPIIGIGRLVR